MQRSSDLKNVNKVRRYTLSEASARVSETSGVDSGHPSLIVFIVNNIKVESEKTFTDDFIRIYIKENIKVSMDTEKIARNTFGIRWLWFLH